MSDKKRILIVDDEQPIADLIGDFCVLLGFETRILNGGEDILEEVKAFRPDLITMDLVMPELSGLEVIEMLKADPETKNIPIVVVSAFVGSSSAEDILSHCRGILAKPLHVHELKEKIDAVLKG